MPYGVKKKVGSPGDWRVPSPAATNTPERNDVIPRHLETVILSRVIMLDYVIDRNRALRNATCDVWRCRSSAFRNAETFPGKQQPVTCAGKQTAV